MFSALFVLECMYGSIQIVRKMGYAVVAVKAITVWISSIQGKEDMKVGYNSEYSKEEQCTECFALGTEPLPPTLEHLRGQIWVLTMTEMYQLLSMVRSGITDPARYDKLVWLSNNRRVAAKAA